MIQPLDKTRSLFSFFFFFVFGGNVQDPLLPQITIQQLQHTQKDSVSWLYVWRKENPYLCGLSFKPKLYDESVAEPDESV